jgi:hypothetical protein
MSDTKNTFTDSADGIVAKTEMERGINTVTLNAPCCGGQDELQITYKTPNDKLVFDVFDLITSKMGLKMDITATRKGDGGG